MDKDKLEMLNAREAEIREVATARATASSLTGYARRPGRCALYTLEERAEINRIKSARRRMLHPELREAHRKVSQEYRERIKAGTVGAVGRPQELTDEERRAKKRAMQAKWRAENIDKARAINTLSEKRRRDEKALAEGRVPGKKGKPKLFTEDEKRAKRKAKSEKWNAAHLDEVREKARLRGQALRDGTFVSRALPRLTAEEKRLTEVAWAAIRRVRMRENGGTFTRDDIMRLMIEQHGLCAFCTNPLGEQTPHVDHWIPIALGGSNGPENLALLHEKCNLLKGAKMPSEFGLPNDPAQLLLAPVTTE